MRKTIAAAAAMLSLLGGSALAADLSYPTKAPAYVAPIQNYDWNGFYIGVMGGGGWGRSRWDNGAITATFDQGGGFLGGTLGYNYQMGAMLLGIETDAAWARIRGEFTTLCGGGLTCFTQLNWFGTTRARLGYAAGPLLPYITGGAAYGGVRAGSVGCAAPGGCASDTRLGWTIGGGLEWMFAPNWSAKAEYLYVDLGAQNLTPVAAAPPISVSERVHTAKVGINYHFNWAAAGPVVARY